MTTANNNQVPNIGQKETSIVRYRFKKNEVKDNAKQEASDKTASMESTLDTVAVESPLEIRIVFGDADNRKDRSLSITMRTPGHDFQLAAGFLLSEGIIRSGSAIESFEFCGPIADGERVSNQLRVNLRSDVDVDMSKLQRHFYTTSSCGVCGKASLDAIESQDVTAVGHGDLRISPALIHDLPQLLRQQQEIFGNTGGLHAAGLFDVSGSLIDLKEDVGRHNAVDKLVGEQLMKAMESNEKNTSENTDENPRKNRNANSDSVSIDDGLVLVVSGRASFELVQKAITAAIPVMVAVGAPSSLAVELADRFAVTLVGFNTGNKFNVYTHNERLASCAPP